MNSSFCLKTWYLICILFIINCIISLINESYDVTFISDKESGLNKTLKHNGYLACYFLRAEYNSTAKEIDLVELKNVVYKRFMHLTNDEDETIAEKIKSEILRRITSKNYLIYRHQFCFNNIMKKELNFFLKISEISYIRFYIYAYNSKTFDFFSFEHDMYEVNQLIILNQEYPYSNCINNYQRFFCLNNCFKKKKKSLKYYYAATETGLVYFDFKSLHKSVSSNDRECFKECKRENCLVTYFTPLEETGFLKANIVISAFDYYCQLIGLICLFIGLSFYQIYFRLSKVLITRLKEIKNTKIKDRFFSLVNYLIFIFISFSCTALMVTKVVNDYKDEKITKLEAVSYQIEPEKLIMVVCIPVEYGADMSEFFGDIFTDLNFEFYKDKTLLKLEEDTNHLFDQTIKEIYLDFQSKKQSINWLKSDKVFFKKVKNELNRCFEILLPKERKYQSLFLSSKFIMKFKHEKYTIYLLSDKKKFTSNTAEFIGENVLSKRKIIRSVNCVNYDVKMYPICTTRSQCVDACIQKKIVEIYKNLSFHSFINKELFVENWSSTYINNTYEIYDKVKGICIDLYKDPSCIKIDFEFKIEKFFKPFSKLMIEIELNYEIYTDLETEVSPYKLVSDILNLQGIFFGLNIIKMMFLTLFLFKAKLSLNQIKFLQRFIYFICSIGFLIHSIIILNDTINNPLIFNQLYEFLDSYEMPDVYFCFHIDQSSMDSNKILSGNHLKEISKELEIENAIEKIVYLNENNEWIQLSRKSSFMNNQFKVSELFFFNYKCFEMKLNIKYTKNQFYFEDQTEVFRVHFNISIFEKNRAIHFFTKPRDTKHFNKITKILIRRNREDFTISSDLYEVVYNDKFWFIKNPLSLFYSQNLNDIDKYIENLLRNYQKISNSKTLYFPLRINNFKENIDDENFEQFYDQFQKLADYNIPSNLNYKRLFILNYFKEYYKKNKENKNFRIYINFLKRTLIVTNEENFSKLIVNLLNILSLWLDYSVLDLHSHLYKLLQKFKFSNFLFLKIQKFFHDKIIDT